MEHSRLLKFFKQQPSSTDMAETPTFKVQIDYQKPENVEAEVPGCQEIREVDTNTVTEVTDDFTLSPVITVTKKEATFTKGDLKLQKVTVTEDISMDEIQNGGQSTITHKYESLQSDGKIITRTTSTTESFHEHSAIDDKHKDERKSKIPLLKFKQTVEKVKKEKRSRKKQDEVVKRPRKSSIPKLSKETKIAINQKYETPKELAPEDEFEKIYEQMSDKQTDVDIKLDDPDKLDSKFEELIHSYEKDDNTSVLQVEKLRQSKIPALRRRKAEGDASKMNSIVNNIRLQNAVRNSREFPIEDEFGEITTKTITTKRFDRVNSREATRTVDDNDVSKDNKEVTKITRIVRQSTKIASPVVTTVTRTEKVTKMDTDDDNIQEEIMTVDTNDDSNDNSKALTKTTRIVKQSSRIATPVVTTVKRTEKVTKEDNNDDTIQEVTMKVDAYDNSNDDIKEVIKTTRIVKQTSRIATPMVTTVTRTKKLTQEYTNDNDTQEVTTVDDYDNSNDDNKEVIKTTRIVKQSSRIATPMVTTVTRTEKITKEDTNDSNIQEVITTVDAYDNSNDNNTEVTKTTRIVKQSSRITTPVITTVTSTEKVTKMDTDDDNNNVISDDINNDIIQRDVTRTQKLIKTTEVGIPVLSMEKSTKVISTHTSVNSDNKEYGETDRLKDSFKIDTTKETNTQIEDTGNTTHHGNTKEVMVTEQIVREGIKIGIPIFTKVTDESSTSDINVDDDKKGDVKADKEKDSIKITHVTRTFSQEDVQNVEISKVLNWKAIDDDRYKQFAGKPIDQESMKKIDMSKKYVTKTINNLETEYKLPEDKVTEQNISVTDKERTNSTDEKETKANITDVTNQIEIKDVNKLKQDKSSDIEVATILKGNVSRLINKLGSRENHEINKEDVSNDSVEIDIVNQERLRRLDKMISEFNKVDFKSIDAQEYAEQSLTKKKIEDSVTYTQDKAGEEVTILKGNVSRLINRLGVKSPETISNRGIIIDVSNKNDENVIKFDEKSTQKMTEQGIYNIKHINTETAVIKKKTVDTSDIIQDNDNTNFFKNTKETIDSVKENDNNIEKLSPKIERDDDTEFELVNAVKNEIVDARKLVTDKNSENDDIIRGSVSRLIRKISTQEIDNSEVVNKDYDHELPKKKSVLSKIAIFESLEPKESYPKASLPRSENKISKLVIKDISISEKPRIVDEVLKDHAILNPNDIDDKDKIGITSVNVSTVKTEPIIVNEIWKTSFNKNGKVHNVSVTQRQETMSFDTHDDKVEVSSDDVINAEDDNDKTNDVEPTTEHVRSNIYFISDNDNVQIETKDAVTENSKQIYDRVKHKYDIYEKNAISISQELIRSESTVQMDTYHIENGATTAEVREQLIFQYPNIKTEEFKDSNEENKEEYVIDDFNNNKPIRINSKEDYKRAKSLAEIDLGDAMIGQVNRIIGRIKSVDFDRVNDVAVKTEKINIKEMPRKSSVLEKIALFEGKARFETSTSRHPRVAKKADIHLVTEEIRQARTTEQGKLTTTKMDISTELPPKIVKKLVITEEMYQEKISELEAAKSLYQPVEVSTMTLGNGVEMPLIALGTALLDPRLIPHIIGAAIDLGYRAIDTAYIYGNEKAIGEAIQAKIDDGTVKREELFIMSKLWSTFHRGDLVETACKQTLANLGLTYIDLYLIHNPMSFKEGGDPIPRIATVLQYSQYDYLDAWFAMENLVTQGLVRSIGVSNFNSSQIQRILDKGRVRPLVNQVECHPYLSQERLDEFCRTRNITLSCFGVLGSKGTPAEYKSSLAPAIDDPLVQVMAHGLNVTPAQLLIRYQIQSGHQVVVKSSSAAHLKDNLDALNFTLSEPQIKALHALNKNKRMFTFIGMGETHKNYPFTAPY